MHVSRILITVGAIGAASACATGHSPRRAGSIYGQCSGEVVLDIFNPLNAAVDIYALSPSPQAPSTLGGDPPRGMHIGSAPSGRSRMSLSATSAEGRCPAFEARVGNAVANGVTVTRR